MKINDRVMTPAGPAYITEIHAKGKTVKVAMSGICIKGVWSFPRPYIQIFAVNKINK